MINLEARRIRRTKNALKMHFIALVKQKGYPAVTVTDIVEQADYNRSTFYAYYLDKEDLANQLLEEMMLLLEESFRKPFEQTKVVQYENIENRVQNTFFQHIFEYRHFYELVTITQTIPNLKDRFLEQFTNIFSNIHYLDDSKNIITIRNYNTYKMYGSYGVILDWIKNGCVECPTQLSENMLTIFQTNSSSFRFI